MRAHVHRIFNPTLVEIYDFMSREECEEIVRDIKQFGTLKDAEVVAKNPETGLDDYSTLSDHRTNSNCFLPYKDSHMAREFLKRASLVCQLHWSQAENIQAVHYNVGEEYKAHHDAFPPESTRLEGPSKNASGNRVATVLLYLNDVEEGGSTSFPECRKTIMPEIGKAVVFSNTYIGTQVKDPQSLHSADPVIKGEKWAVNLWFRNREETNLNYQEWLKERHKELEN
jgi:prolyl 4-hydroxylase